MIASESLPSFVRPYRRCGTAAGRLFWGVQNYDYDAAIVPTKNTNNNNPGRRAAAASCVRGLLPLRLLARRVRLAGDGTTNPSSAAFAGDGTTNPSSAAAATRGRRYGRRCGRRDHRRNDPGNAVRPEGAAEDRRLLLLEFAPARAFDRTVGKSRNVVARIRRNTDREADTRAPPPLGRREPDRRGGQASERTATTAAQFGVVVGSRGVGCDAVSLLADAADADAEGGPEIPAVFLDFVRRRRYLAWSSRQPRLLRSLDFRSAPFPSPRILLGDTNREGNLCIVERGASPSPPEETTAVPQLFRLILRVQNERGETAFSPSFAPNGGQQPNWFKLVIQRVRDLPAPRDEIF